VVCGKVGGTPAVNRSADILGGAYNQGEDNEKDNGMSVAESVY